MSATVIINRLTGTDPTKDNITDTNTRLKADDTHSVSDSTNPVRVPDSGTNYSYWCSTRMEVTTNTEGNTISNMKFYTDGSNDLGTGLGMDIALASAYDQAVGVEGTSGSAIDGNHSNLISSVTGAFNYDSSNPLDIDATVTGTSSTGDIGDFVITQGTVDSTAGAGASSQETYSYQYDEA